MTDFILNASRKVILAMVLLNIVVAAVAYHIGFDHGSAAVVQMVQQQLQGKLCL